MTGYSDDVTDPTRAARFDAGKPRLELVPTEIFEGMAAVFGGPGVKKYGPWNWAKGFPWLQPYASMQRHLMAWHGGEDLDPETGLSHLWHAACNLAMLCHFIKHGIGEDNRLVRVREGWAAEAARRKLLSKPGTYDLGPGELTISNEAGEEVYKGKTDYFVVDPNPEPRELDEKETFDAEAAQMDDFMDSDTLIAVVRDGGLDAELADRNRSRWDDGPEEPLEPCYINPDQYIELPGFGGRGPSRVYPAKVPEQKGQDDVFVSQDCLRHVEYGPPIVDISGVEAAGRGPLHLLTDQTLERWAAEREDKDRPRRAYLAGPMRGKPNHNFPAFDRARTLLRADGWDVWCPAEHDRAQGFDETKPMEEQPGWNIEDLLRKDLQVVLNADAIILLPGWEDSSGALAEAFVAARSGRLVYEFCEYPSEDEDGYSLRCRDTGQILDFVAHRLSEQQRADRDRRAA